MKRYISLFLCAVAPFLLVAQNDDSDVKKSFDEFRESMMMDFNNSRNRMLDDYQSFRGKIMKDYVDFVRRAWSAFDGCEPEPVPEEQPVPPVVMPDEDKVLPIDDKPIPIETIFEPEPPMPQPQPIEPIKVVPEVKNALDFSFFGTKASVRFDIADRVVLKGVDENSIADALEKMSGKSHDNMIIDCLEIRRKNALSDWAYIQMLDALAKSIHGNDRNSATLLTAYLFMQSGYKMRLASDGSKLYMLYASEHCIYEQPSFLIDNCRYYGLGEIPVRLYICEASYEKESPLSLYITGTQNLAFSATEVHHIESVDYPGFGVDVCMNRNLLDFYNTYPTSMIGDNIYSRWAMYANTKMDKNISKKLYPALKAQLQGLSEVEKAERLLNMVQTGFEYEYDDKVWGCDRVFFPDEAIFYPQNDCDDRSVLFSRLVRDLLGLEAALVFVPGHVLVGVCFNETVDGDHVLYKGKRFTLCEPTCTNGAPVGWSNIKPEDELNVYLLER